MRQIWSKDRLYSFLRPYVDFCTKTSYSDIKVLGRENIPSDGAVIIAPNHCNALMDALVVLQSDKSASAYGARADVFRNPNIAAILRRMRIVPLARARDGAQAVAGNTEVFDEVVECLKHGVPFCIFSEGTHRPKHSVLPLKKGIFRIAVKAASQMEKPVYIVPAGIEYSDYFRYMESAVLRYGEPINVTEYVAGHPDMSEAEMYRELSLILHDSIAKLITYFPDDENYDRAESEWKNENTKPSSWIATAGKVILSALSLPLFVLCAVLSAPMWIASWLIGSTFKDKSWLNTVRFGTKMALLPFLVLLVAGLAFLFLPWYCACALVLLSVYAHSLFFLCLKLYRSILP